MATYSFHDKVTYYLRDPSTGYAGWGTYTFGTARIGGPIAGYQNTDWRTIVGFDVIPATGQSNAPSIYSYALRTNRTAFYRSFQGIIHSSYDNIPYGIHTRLLLA